MLPVHVLIQWLDTWDISKLTNACWNERLDQQVIRDSSHTSAQSRLAIQSAFLAQTFNLRASLWWQRALLQHDLHHDANKGVTELRQYMRLLFLDNTNRFAIMLGDHEAIPSLASQSLLCLLAAIFITK